MAESDDFVGILHDLANFIQNQRVAAYNEAVDEVRAAVRAWICSKGCNPIMQDDKSLEEILQGFLEDWDHMSKVDSEMASNG